MNSSRTTVVFIWTVISGYMAACWRAMAARPDIDLLVIAYRPSVASNSGFHDSILEGVPHQLLDEVEREDAAGIIKRVIAHRPDIIVTTGWWRPAYREVAYCGELSGAAFIMGLDTPWRTPLQYLNRLRYPRYLARLDAVVPAGERAWQHARNLGIAPEKIFRGQYGVDVARLRAAYEERATKTWPRRLLFAGRFVEEKGIDVLVAAYSAYRERVSDPWELCCCGQGPLGRLFDGVPGIEDVGFVQPADMMVQWERAGAFVIPSRFDPWPLALVEACAAGLPVVASEACGSAVEVLRPYYNGLLVPEGSVSGLTDALVSIHAQVAQLPEWGDRSLTLAAPYGTDCWVERWIETFRTVLKQRGNSS